MSNDPVQTIHETYLSRYENGAQDRPDGEVYRSGRITVISGGGDHPMFNMGFVLEPPDIDELREAVRWIENQEVPFWLNIADDALPTVKDSADDLGLSPNDMVLSGMLRPTLEELPQVVTAAEISAVSTADDLEAFRTVFEAVFDVQMQEQSEDSGGDDRSHAYIGRIDGRAVACGGAVRIGEVANVFGMGVLGEFRGRGIGTAICSEALRAAREAGCELATLESTPMAVSVYESVGFETHVNYNLYELDD